MKRTNTILILFFSALLITACHCNDRKKLKGSLIDLEMAIEFRNNFVNCPNQLYHIPQAFMYETGEFNALFGMSGIDKIRLYPAINTHNDPADDSLTLIMVPVNASDNTDNLTDYLFEFGELCPSDCGAATGPVPAPMQKVLNLQIPTNWCIDQSVIDEVITRGEAVVGEGNVYGIRFFWYNNQNNIMDLELRPTTVNGDNIDNIPGVSASGVTKICIDNAGCCDPDSKLYKSGRKK
jgi:hypothetical protein